MGHDRLTVISIHNTTTHWNPILEHKPSLAPHSDYFVSHRVADLRLAHTAVALEQIAHTARITHVSCLYRWLWSRLNWHRLWHCFDAGSARCQALRTGLLLASNRVAALLLPLESLAVSLQCLNLVARLEHTRLQCAASGTHAESRHKRGLLIGDKLRA